MEREYQLLDVFTDRPFTGNPLAVFMHAAGMTGAQMQAVAGELNLSETAFLDRRTASGAWPLRIFTPKVELPFAGHPTIGAALAMAEHGLIKPHDGAPLTFAESAGSLAVRLDWHGSKALRGTLTIEAMPEAGPPLHRPALANLLGLAESDIGDADLPLAPAARSMGVPFTLTPLKDRDALARASLDLALWRAAWAGTWAPHLYLFTSDADDADFRARMFAPGMGIAEDPATGAAAAALAADLADALGPFGEPRPRVIAQGVEMGRPSRLHIAARRAIDGAVAVEVGGAAVSIGRGTMRLPDATPPGTPKETTNV